MEKMIPDTAPCILKQLLPDRLQNPDGPGNHSQNRGRRQSRSKAPRSVSKIGVKVGGDPIDFTRRRLTTVNTVVTKMARRQMVTKEGAVEEMLSICSLSVTAIGAVYFTETVRKRILLTVGGLNDKGFRVLTIAQKQSFSGWCIWCKDEK